MTNPDNIVRVRARLDGRASVYEANGWAQAYTTGRLSLANAIVPDTPVGMNVRTIGSTDFPTVLIAQNPAGYKIALDIVGDQAITITAPASQSRITSIVAYTDDLSLASTDSATTGSPSSCGLIVVNGNTSSSPTPPTPAQIQTAITADGGTGSQACFCVIADILVTSSATAITNSQITNYVAELAGTSVVKANNIDFTTMKRWVPDYDNASSTNLWSGTNTATMTDTGWVACKICGFKANALCEMYINVNNVNVGVDVTEARSPSNAVTATVCVFVPVSAGDIVKADFNGASINWRYCYFIPGKWV